MSRSSSPKRGRGRPRREYRIRVRGERRVQPDYDKLARALLEHAAMEEARRLSGSSKASEPLAPDCSRDIESSSPNPIQTPVDGDAYD